MKPALCTFDVLSISHLLGQLDQSVADIAFFIFWRISLEYSFSPKI